MKENNRKRRNQINNNVNEILQLKPILNLIKSRDDLKEFIDYFYNGLGLILNNYYEDK